MLIVFRIALCAKRVIIFWWQKPSTESQSYSKSANVWKTNIKSSRIFALLWSSHVYPHALRVTQMRGKIDEATRGNSLPPGGLITLVANMLIHVVPSRKTNADVRCKLSYCLHMVNEYVATIAIYFSRYTHTWFAIVGVCSDYCCRVAHLSWMPHEIVIWCLCMKSVLLWLQQTCWT